VLETFRMRIAWARAAAPNDAHLIGSWVPDASHPEFPYVVSCVFERDTGFMVHRQDDGPHFVRFSYRIAPNGRLLLRSDDDFHVSRGTTRCRPIPMSLDGGTYRRAKSWDDRGWPDDLSPSYRSRSRV
jgi:hypothetical protein